MDEYDSYEVEEVGIYLFIHSLFFKVQCREKRVFFPIKDCTLYEQ